MRALLPIGIIAVMAAMAPAGCGSSGGGPTFVAVTGFDPGNCTGTDYIVVDDSVCGGCGGTAYDVCSGTAYDDCECSIPVGGNVVVYDGPGAFGSGDDGGTGDDGGGEASTDDGGGEASSDDGGGEASSDDGGGDDGSSSDDGGTGGDDGGSGGDDSGSGGD